VTLAGTARKTELRLRSPLRGSTIELMPRDTAETHEDRSMKITAIMSAAFLVAVIAASPRASQSLAPHRVLALAERVADWQLARMQHTEGMSRQTAETANARGWEQGAFWVGMTRLADVTRRPRYRDAILAQGRSNSWRLGDRPYHADDHVIGQSYLWAARHGAGAEVIAPMRSF
jgi:unsaturated rhamnogalacturonyl hydrolase